ncbi:MAG: DNA-processing protein DprA [Clostridia bacterium]|nr:DNA-processing protein DprA [Clostridia bacterium]
MSKIQIIKKENKRYPQKLKQIYSPPQILYAIGNTGILNLPSISIVGGREHTEYGKKSAYYFSYNLAKAGLVIVSGLAKGIDSFSHIGCLAAKGKTIAIIGSGLDNIYPKENEELAKKIIEAGGCIISEYPLGTKPEKRNFPERNRIISGISNSVLVVEAKEKSGSLITANFALEQGKDVFAVPGNINSKNSIGTNLLIQEGAIPVINYKDILKNS